MKATIRIVLDSPSMDQATFKGTVDRFVQAMYQKRREFGLQVSGLNISIIADEKEDLMEAK